MRLTLNHLTTHSFSHRLTTDARNSQGLGQQVVMAHKGTPDSLQEKGTITYGKEWSSRFKCNSFNSITVHLQIHSGDQNPVLG